MKQQPVCDDKAALVAYVYGECTDDERWQVERHLEHCQACASEVRALGSVRGALRDWAPPEQSLGFRVVRESDLTVAAPRARERRPGLASRWVPPVPAWAQLAAAVLVLAAGAAIANLDVTLGNGGVTVRTGWQRAAAVQQAGAPVVQGTPWRADLASLEQQLRAEISAIPAAEPGAGGGATRASVSLSAGDRASLLRQLQPDVESIAERLQRQADQQIAARFLRFAHDMDIQRVSDQQRILQGINQIDARTAQLSRVQNIMLRGSVQEIR